MRRMTRRIRAIDRPFMVVVSNACDDVLETILGGRCGPIVKTRRRVGGGRIGGTTDGDRASRSGGCRMTSTGRYCPGEVHPQMEGQPQTPPPAPRHSFAPQPLTG